jgi:hypothetical protein
MARRAADRLSLRRGARLAADYGVRHRVAAATRYVLLDPALGLRDDRSVYNTSNAHRTRPPLSVRRSRRVRGSDTADPHRHR